MKEIIFYNDILVVLRFLALNGIIMEVNPICIMEVNLISSLLDNGREKRMKHLKTKIKHDHISLCEIEFGIF